MTFRIVKVALFAALFGLSGAKMAAAEDDAKVDCDNAQSTVEMNQCADEELGRADAKLNAAYKNALAAIPGLASEKPYDAKSWEAALRASQRAWITFRDAECKDHRPMFWSGGTGTTLEVLSCLKTKTDARTKELIAAYEGQ